MLPNPNPILRLFGGLFRRRKHHHRPKRKVFLKLTSVQFNHKTKRNSMDPVSLRSPVTQFALLVLAPIDADGNRVSLDADAIVVEIAEGAPTGARSVVKAIEDTAGRRFEVSLITGDSPGETTFTLKGDAQPGEGVVIIEEKYIYTTTPNNAVGLGTTVQYLSKSSAPAAEPAPTP